MAPYGGPNLAESIGLLLEGKVPSPLGIGIPKAHFSLNFETRSSSGKVPANNAGLGMKLIALQGGLGFGVQAELLVPFSEGDVLADEPTVLGLCVALIKRWDTEAFGEPFRTGDALHVRIRPPREAVPQFRQELRRAMVLNFDETKDVASSWELVSNDLKRLQKLVEIVEDKGGELVGISVPQRPLK